MTETTLKISLATAVLLSGDWEFKVGPGGLEGQGIMDMDTPWSSNHGFVDDIPVKKHDLIWFGKHTWTKTIYIYIILYVFIFILYIYICVWIVSHFVDYFPIKNDGFQVFRVWLLDCMGKIHRACRSWMQTMLDIGCEGLFCLSFWVWTGKLNGDDVRLGQSCTTAQLFVPMYVFLSFLSICFKNFGDGFLNRSTWLKSNHIKPFVNGLLCLFLMVFWDSSRLFQLYGIC